MYEANIFLPFMKIMCFPRQYTPAFGSEGWCTRRDIKVKVAGMKLNAKSFPRYRNGLLLLFDSLIEPRSLRELLLANIAGHTFPKLPRFVGKLASNWGDLLRDYS
jgi:hypothetical protein